MKKKFVLLAFASLFLLSTVIGSQLIVAVAAQSVGVSPGDWAEYGVIYSGNATMPPPSELPEWVKITVLEISGTNITFEEITRYMDHHNETKTYVVDVDTGQGNGTGLFIAANLTQGDLIYTSPPPSSRLFGICFQGATINETISREYLGETVEVNHLNLTMSETFPGWTLTNSTNSYWYRATGLPAEFSLYMLAQPGEGDPMEMKMEAVIIDIIPEFPPALILPLLMIATLAAVWLGKTIWATKKSIKKPSPCA